MHIKMHRIAKRFMQLQGKSLVVEPDRMLLSYALYMASSLLAQLGELTLPIACHPLATKLVLLTQMCG
jgi:hypothetical protein